MKKVIIIMLIALNILIVNARELERKEILDIIETSNVDTVKIKHENTLWDISKEYYGDPFLWKDILQFNYIPDPNMIYPGDVILVPRDKKTLKELLSKRHQPKKYKYISPSEAMSEINEERAGTERLIPLNAIDKEVEEISKLVSDTSHLDTGPIDKVGTPDKIKLRTPPPLYPMTVEDTKSGQKSGTFSFGKRGGIEVKETQKKATYGIIQFRKKGGIEIIATGFDADDYEKRKEQEKAKTVREKQRPTRPTAGIDTGLVKTEVIEEEEQKDVYMKTEIVFDKTPPELVDAKLQVNTFLLAGGAECEVIIQAYDKYSELSPKAQFEVVNDEYYYQGDAVFEKELNYYYAIFQIPREANDPFLTFKSITLRDVGGNSKVYNIESDAAFTKKIELKRLKMKKNYFTDITAFITLLLYAFIR